MKANTDRDAVRPVVHREVTVPSAMIGTVPPRAVGVYVAIVGWAHDDPPSRREIAALADCSTPTVDRMTRALVDAGWLAREQRYEPDPTTGLPRQVPTAYWVPEPVDPPAGSAADDPPLSAAIDQGLDLLPSRPVPTQGQTLLSPAGDGEEDASPVRELSTDPQTILADYDDNGAAGARRLLKLGYPQQTVLEAVMARWGTADQAQFVKAHNAVSLWRDQQEVVA